MLPEKTLASLTDRDAWFRHNMPYHFKKLDLPGHVYLPLNRDYLPLGMQKTNPQPILRYEDFADKAVKFARDPSSFEGVWGQSPLFLYHDGMNFRGDYFERLEKLFGRSAKVTK